MASEDNKIYIEAFRCGGDKNHNYQFLGTLCQEVDFHRVNYESISHRAKIILFLISTLPAFLELTKTQEIRQREVTTLLSSGEKVLRKAYTHRNDRPGTGALLQNENENRNASTELLDIYSPSHESLPVVPVVNMQRT